MPLASSSLLASMFQSTPPHGRRLVFRDGDSSSESVSIHASAREATRSGRKWYCLWPVSIHASAREATQNAQHQLAEIEVSIHASAREATLSTSQWWPAQNRFQSTPPHGRRHVPRAHGPAVFGVSIHASAREATAQRAGEFAGKLVSIHASAREATPPRTVWPPIMAGFQSTPPHGRRHASAGVNKSLSRVSIHASAREATPPCTSGRRVHQVSIHASAREATPTDFSCSTSPGCFNPRLRTGGDSALESAVSGPRPVSIHASAREATAGSRLIQYRAIGFQSTPPHGRRLSASTSLLTSP